MADAPAAAAAPGVDPAARRRLEERETDLFAQRHPKSLAWLRDSADVLPAGVPMSWMREMYRHPPPVVDHAEGLIFTDLDGNRFRDFNLGDMSVLAGWAHPVVQRAAAERLAAGGQFLLPTDDDRIVATELRSRLGRPKWRFTLSATQANVEALRICRAATERPVVLYFDGKYHGHADELLLGGLDRVSPEVRGVPDAGAAVTRVVPFNDLSAVERALDRGDVACVLIEPALTNVGVVLPEPGFHEGLRRLCTDAGAYLVYDETHTLAAGPGGLTALWDLSPDAVTLGKGIAGGMPIGAYGLSEELAEVATGGEDSEEVASGGTLFGYALGMAVARAFLTEVLTEEAYDHAAVLGSRLANGIEAAAAGHGLEWRAHRLRNRSGVTHGPRLPRNAGEARETFDTDLFNLQRLYLLNRGIWEAIDSAGPAVSLVADDSDVDAYLAAFDGFLTELS
jgi:glutamate-1-semialdehyde 2,1-aminomutase